MAPNARCRLQPTCPTLARSARLAATVPIAADCGWGADRADRASPAHAACCKPAGPALAPGHDPPIHTQSAHAADIGCPLLGSAQAAAGTTLAPSRPLPVQWAQDVARGRRAPGSTAVTTRVFPVRPSTAPALRRRPAGGSMLRLRRRPRCRPYPTLLASTWRQAGRTGRWRSSCGGSGSTWWLSWATQSPPNWDVRSYGSAPARV